MKKVAVLFLAALLTGCGKEKTTVPVALSPDRNEAKPVAVVPISDKAEAKPTPRGRKKVQGHGYPKLSPFEAVRWRGSVPEVRVKGDWYELLAFNGISAKEIIAFLKSVEKKEDGQQKRFEEDLVELLILMGHDPGKSATLKVRQLDSGQEKELKDVPMTEKNRDAIRDARQKRSQRNARPANGPVARLTRKQAEADLDQLASLAARRLAAK